MLLMLLIMTSQLNYRTDLVEKYEKYAEKYLNPGQEVFPGCGIRSPQDYTNRFAFFFPIGSNNEFYVDDMGALQYFTVNKDGEINRKWSATSSLDKSPTSLQNRTNNFIIASSYGTGSIKSQCGKLPRDKRAMDVFYFGHSYAKIGNNGKQICRKEIGDQLQNHFKDIVAINFRCDIKTNK